MSEIDSHIRLQARQVKVPQPGTIAPDFELDVVTRQRKATSERVRLSALRGDRVGLVFGFLYLTAVS